MEDDSKKEKHGNRRHHDFAPGAAPWWVTLSISPISHAPCGPLWATWPHSARQ